MIINIFLWFGIWFVTVLRLLFWNSTSDTFEVTVALFHYSMWESRDLRSFHTENTNVTQPRQSILLCQWHTPQRWSPPPLCQTTRGRTFLPDSHADASNTRAWLRKQKNGSATRQSLTQMTAQHTSFREVRTAVGTGEEAEAIGLCIRAARYRVCCKRKKSVCLLCISLMYYHSQVVKVVVHAYMKMLSWNIVYWLLLWCFLSFLGQI